MMNYYINYSKSKTYKFDALRTLVALILDGCIFHTHLVGKDIYFMSTHLMHPMYMLLAMVRTEYFVTLATFVKISDLLLIHLQDGFPYCWKCYPLCLDDFSILCYLLSKVKIYNYFRKLSILRFFLDLFMSGNIGYLNIVKTKLRQ